MTRSRNNQTPGRPYPRRCHACREKTVERAIERRTVEATYDGRRYPLDIAEFPVNRCSKCGASTLDYDADEMTNRALRDELKLLQPEEIRSNREALGFTQQQLAEHLGCASESISRWENDYVIQSRTYDRLLRAFFHLPSFREFLVTLTDDPWLGREISRAVESEWQVPSMSATAAHKRLKFKPLTNAVFERHECQSERRSLERGLLKVHRTSKSSDANPASRWIQESEPNRPVKMAG